MNEKYMAYWNYAKEIGIANNDLKKALRNLSRIEKRMLRKGKEVPNSFAYIDEEGSIHFDHIIFKMKGSNRNERLDAIIKYGIEVAGVMENAE